MRKIKIVVLLVLLGGLIYGISYVWRAFPIISGYGAKGLCSCVFVAGRTPASAIDNEMGNFPLSLGSYTIDKTDSSAYGNVLGMARRKAIYRKGLGCTLVSELSEEAIRKQQAIVPPGKPLADSLAWPLGNGGNPFDDTTVNMELLNKAIVAAFNEDDPEKPQNTRAVVVVYRGRIIGEKYAAGFTRDTPQLGWSMTKSVTNALLGMLVKDGKLQVEQPVPIATWSGDDDPRRNITLDNMLRMSSGLEWEENYSGPSGATNMLYKKADMGGYAAGFPLEAEPGKVWYYSSGTSNILSQLIREKTGTGYYRFARSRLFNILGMESATIEPDASGTFVGSSYMFATPRDWARFGLLYLHDGMWNEERILPEGWVKYSSQPTAGTPQGEYGAHFWLNAGAPGDPADRWYPDAPATMFSMNGYEGQRVFILPSQDLVVVRMGLTKRGNFDFNEFLKHILEAFPAG